MLVGVEAGGLGRFDDAVKHCAGLDAVVGFHDDNERVDFVRKVPSSVYPAARDVKVFTLVSELAIDLVAVGYDGYGEAHQELPVMVASAGLLPFVKAHWVWPPMGGCGTPT